MSGAARVALQTEAVTVRYGGVTANDAVDLVAEPGSIVGLIGPNGAGKTSFIDAVTGFTPYTGHVRLGDATLDPLPAHRRRRAGLARTWQAGELFSSLSVLDNVRVAVEQANWGTFVTDFLRRAGGSRPSALEALELVGLADRAADEPEDLSLGQQKLVGVARALAGGPSVLLLDEPAAGLDSRESQAIGRQLCQIAADGPAILLVDHDMDLVFEVCQTVYVLDFGKVIAHGPPEHVRSDERVIMAYLGASTSREERQ